MFKFKALALLALVSLWLYAFALRARTTNGSITGRVEDASKGAIEGAKVEVVNSGTNFRYESTTNGAGEYTLANLPPGTYRLEVEKSGLKKLIRTDVTLHVQDALAIDFEMAVGSVFETVRVEAGAPLVNTTSATVSTLLDQTFVENMPLNGRSFQTLIMLTPGVVVTQTAFDDQRQDHLPKPEERQNDFGGVFGGPILKDRTFFFFSYEGLRLRQPATQETVVPDTASRQQAPTSMQPYLNAYPVPNGPELGGIAQFNGSYSNPSSLDAGSIRIDHAINSKLSLFGRYNNSPSSTTVLGRDGSLSSTRPLDSSVQTLTIRLTHLISPTASNEVRANYSNHRVKGRYGLDNFGSAVPVADSVLFPSGYSSSNANFEVYIVGVGGWLTGKSATDEPMTGPVLFRITGEGREFLLEEGTDQRYGARHLKRAIERYVAYPIARLLATAQVHQGDALVIDHHFSEEGLVFLRDTEYQSSDLPLPNPELLMTAEGQV